jgi:CRISPR type I-E-associated protein CasB/Cse2
VAFYRFAMRFLPDEWDRGSESVDDWVTVVGGLALLSPGGHDPHHPLGRGLADLQYSEARLERLLAAEGPVLRTLVIRMARFLAAKGRSVNWADAARLVLTHDASAREQLRRLIASDFYHTVTKG